MPGSAITAGRPDVDPVGAPGRRRRRPRELATQRLPRMPRRAIPVTIPELAVGEDREHLQTIDAPRGRGGGGRQRSAQRLRLVPGPVMEGPVDEGAVEVGPEDVDAVLAPGDGADRRVQDRKKPPS